jgi:hypothetical protein
MSCSSPEPTREALAQAFSRRLAAAMRERGWKPIPSVLLKHFNRVHWGEPITLYTTRSWLRGQYMPRPHRLVSLALCLGVPPDRLMYGQFYQVPCASESGPSLLLSDREHRLVQCLRRLAPQDQWRVEQLAWRSLVPPSQRVGG